MIDELIKERIIYVDGSTYTFTIKSLSGKRVHVGIGCRSFDIDFNIDNEYELQIIAKTLNAMINRYQVIDKDEKIVTREIADIVEDYYKLMGIILSFKGREDE